MLGKSIHSLTIHWILFVFAQGVIAACQVTGGGSSGINPKDHNAHIPSSMLKVPVSRCAAHGESSGGAPCPSSPSPAASGTTPSAVPQWFQIVYAPSIGTQNPLVLNVANNTAGGGENIILWPLQANSRNELWQYTQSGQFVSGVGDYWYNTFTSSKSPAQPMALSQMNGIVVSEASQTGTLEGGADQFQQWKITPDCLTTQCGSGAVIQNQLTGGYLVSSGTQGQVTALASNPQAQWVFWPPRTLQIILNETNSNFPTFTGNQLTAYNDISAEVSPSLSGNSCTYEGIAVTGIRCQYSDMDATRSGALASYLAQIDALPVQKGISSSDWKAVVGQLTTEITDVELVQGLYDNYNDFYNGLFINNQATLNQMISDAGLTASSPNGISGKGIAIMEGVLYTVIEGVGGFATGKLAAGIGAIGNLTETAINGAVANGSVSQNNFQATVSTLWGKLSSDFISIQTVAGTNETSIDEDWGRLQAVSALIVSTGPDSLRWTSMETPDLVAALQPGFEVATMQMLLPAKYWLDPIPHITDSNLIQFFNEDYHNPPPSYDFLETSIGNGVYNFSAIASGANNELFVTPFPGQAPMQNDLFNNGVSQLALFNNLNGWNFPLSWTNWNGASPFPTGSATGCNQLIVSVINQTGDNLKLFLNGNHGSLLGSTSRYLASYSTVQVGLRGDTSIHGPDFNFCVTNANNSSCSSSNGNYVQFEVQQNHCSLAAGDITYKQSGSHLYQSSQLDQTTGSYAKDIPGIASVAIYNPSASQ